MSKVTDEKKDKHTPHREDVYQLIVNELDHGRDVLQLYKQLAHALPIKSFDDLVNACGKNGKEIAFRDVSVPIAFFEDLIPGFLFPIMDDRSLVSSLAQFVQAFPSDIGYDSNKLETQRIMSRRQFANALIPSANNFSTNALAAEPSFQTKVNLEELRQQLKSDQ